LIIQICDETVNYEAVEGWHHSSICLWQAAFRYSCR
jgi:hypothetical protein